MSASDHSNITERQRRIAAVTLAGSGVNALLIVLKFVAGVAGRSSAMIADAIHSLSDFITDIIVVVFVRIANRPSDRNHRYGHGKFETFATLIIGVILMCVAIGVCASGCKEVAAALGGAVLPRPGMWALWVAVVSIVLKEGLYRVTVVYGRKLDSTAVMANAWHHRSDAFSSIGTLAGVAGAMFLGEKWRLLDPLAAIAVSFFIGRVAYQISKPCIDELMERSLPADVEAEILNIIGGVEGVSRPHNLRTRRIGNNVAIEVHVRMDGDLPLRKAHALASDVESRLRERFGEGTHVGLHMEPQEATHHHQEDDNV